MTNEKAIQKTLEKTVKLFDLAAGADKLYRLGFSNALFVPVNIDADDENAIFTYHLDELSPVSSIQNFTICEKLRMLLNISGLFGISDEYSFSLEPDNVYIDRNLEPKILFRDLNSEDNRHDFIEEYKALIGCMLHPRYHFDDYLKGGGSLYKKKKLLRPFIGAQTVSDIKNILKEQYARESKIQRQEKVFVDRRRYKIMQILTPVLLALFLIAGFVAVYIGLIALPFERTLLASEHYFLREDFDSAIDSLRNIEPESLPKETRYQLARAYVNSESLTRAQKDNILSGLTVRTEDNILYYWIYIGRLDFDNAIDMAHRIGSDELILYALVSYEVHVQNDAALTGEEKSTRLSELSQQISNLEKEILDKEEALD